jgi:uncharacterized protein YndB with AHSA1/START domain
MISFKQTAIIDAPVETVFNIISDFSRIPEWRKEVPRISNISGPAKTGSTFLEEVHFMGRKQLLMQVKDFIPNKLIIIEAVSGMNLLPTQKFEFIPQNDKTRIDLSVDMEVKGFFKLMQGMLPGQLKKTWAKYFSDLNTLVKNA